MRILCLSSAFPPHRGSEAFCAGKMVLALKDSGVHVSVFYMDGPQYAAQHDASELWHDLGTDSFRVTHCANRDRARAALFALRYHTVAWSRWIRDVVKSATQLHGRIPFDIIYSRSPSLCNQVAGYWLVKKLKLPWIVNINDPWDYHLFPDASVDCNSPFQARMSNFWLRRTLASADAVTYPCRRLANFTSRLAGFEPCTEIIAHIGMVSSVPMQDNGFRLVHAGKLGSKEITGRSTRALLLGLRRFLNSEPEAMRITQLVLVGAEDPHTNASINELGLKSNVTNVGQVTYGDSLGHIASAAACVLIEGDMREGIYLPSKLADYVMARKPVLALSPAVGTVADMSSDSAIIRVDQDDDKAIEAAVNKLYQAYVNGTLVNFVPSDQLVDQFKPAVVADQFLKLASQLTNRTIGRGNNGKTDDPLRHTVLAAR